MFESVLVFNVIRTDLYTMQVPPYLDKIVVLSILRLRMMVLTQITSRVYKDSLTLKYPPDINI